MKNLLLIMFCFALTIFTSCEKSIYYDFSEEEKDLFVYDEGETFSLLKEPLMDTILFQITRKKLFYVSAPAVITPEEHHYQTLTLDFKSDNNYSGFFSGEMSSNPNPSIEISIIQNYTSEFEGSLCDTLYSYNLNGQNYPELFVFAKEKGKNPMLYFSKDKGIVFIDSTASGSSYSLIEYVKK